jgi:hypothetical protein
LRRQGFRLVVDLDDTIGSAVVELAVLDGGVFAEQADGDAGFGPREVLVWNVG